MLTPLPRLFQSINIQSDETLERFGQLAQRQKRRVIWSLAAVGAVALGSLVPQLQQPGPILLWAARAWPATFGPVVAWGERATQPWELGAALALVGIAGGLLSYELLRLKAFLYSLKLLPIGQAERDVFAAEGDPPSNSVAYLLAVEKVRPLRLGDWTLSVSLLHEQFPDLGN